MAQDSPHDKRHVLVALLRPSPVSLAVCRSIGGPRPPAVAVFFDREEHIFSLMDVAAP
jgi:hypothetical protein